MESKRKLRESIYLIGNTSYQIFGCKLPSIKQLLSVFFFTIYVK